MATPPANAALLEHICVWDGEVELEVGGGRGASGSKFLTLSCPLRPILLPVDKCRIQAWWQLCRGETDAVASAQADLH